MKLKNKIIAYFLIVSLAIAIPLVVFYTAAYNEWLYSNKMLVKVIQDLESLARYLNLPVN